MTQNEEIKNTMNKVIEICSVQLDDGTQTISEKDIIGKSRREDILMARCLFVDTHKKKVEDCTTLLAELDPQRKKDAEVDARFNKIENSVSEIKDLLSNFLNKIDK